MKDTKKSSFKSILKRSATDVKRFWSHVRLFAMPVFVLYLSILNERDYSNYSRTFCFLRYMQPDDFPPPCVWTIPLIICACFRFRAPGKAATAYLFFYALHFIFGPMAVFGDFLILPVVYNAVLLETEENLKKFKRRFSSVNLLYCILYFFNDMHGPLFGYPYGTSYDNPYRITESVFRAISAFLFMSFTVFCAFWQRMKKQSARLISERNKALKAGSEKVRKNSAMRERARIAREMHDVIAHSLSVIIAQADGGRFAVQSNRSVAYPIMETVNREAKDALSNMQILLGIIEPENAPGSDYAADSRETSENHADNTAIALDLSRSSMTKSSMTKSSTAKNGSFSETGRRAANAANSISRAASYENVGRLIEQARKSDMSGLKIIRKIEVLNANDESFTAEIKSVTENEEAACETAGAKSKFDAQASVAIYRLIQESLTNIRKYAGNNVTVRILEKHGISGADISIEDDGRGSSSTSDGHKPGYGLAGMSERISALGGSFSAGPRIGGGFCVAAFIPYKSLKNDDFAEYDILANPEDPQQAAFKKTNLGETGSHEFANADMQTESQKIFESGSSSGNSSRNNAKTGAENGAENARKTGFFRKISAKMRDRNNKNFKNKDRKKQNKKRNRKKLSTTKRIFNAIHKHDFEVDIAFAAIIIVYRTLVCYSALSRYSVHPSFFSIIFLPYFSSALRTVPVIFRRSKPESAFAAACAINCLIPLFAENECAYIIACFDMPVMCFIVFSFILYGKKRSRERLFFWLAAQYASLFATGNDKVQILILSALCMGVYISVAVFARYVRLRGNNLFLLREQEKSLRNAQKQSELIAAKQERNRICSYIQEEITLTLSNIIDLSEDGMNAAKNSETPSDQIVKIFEQTADMARDSLLRVRRILKLLRENASDLSSQSCSSGSSGDFAPVSPAPPISEQLKNANFEEHLQTSKLETE